MDILSGIILIFGIFGAALAVGFFIEKMEKGDRYDNELEEKSTSERKES